jgi:ligand-binding sensor domain-containing protein
MKKILYLLVILLNFTILYSQNPEWVKINDQRVFNIAETPDSYFYHFNSLFRIDKKSGSREKYSLPFNSNDITELFYSDSLLWIITNGRYYKFNYGHWGDFKFDSSFIVQYRVLGMCSDSSSNLWLKRAGSISKFNGMKYEVIFIGMIFSQTDLICDRNNFIWFKTVYNDVYKYKDSLDLVADSNNYLLKDNRVYNLNIDKNDDIIMCSKKGLLRYNNNDTLLFDPLNDILPEQPVTDMIIDKDNNYWFIGNDKIMYLKNDSLVVFDSTDHELLYNISDIEVDSNNNVYVSCSRFGSEILKYDGSNWSNIDFNLPLHNPISGIQKFLFDNEDNLWVLGPGGDLHSYKNGKTSTYTPFPYDRLFDYYTTTSIMLDAENNIWAGNLDGNVAKLEKGKWTTYFAKDYSLRADSEKMAKDSSGNLWFASDDGLIKYNSQITKRIILNGFDPFDYYDYFYRTNTIAVDKDNFKYFAYRDSLVVYDDTSLVKYQIPLLHDNGTRINDIQIESGKKVWISSGSIDQIYYYDRFDEGSGLFLFDGDSIKRFDTLNSGISALSLSNIAIDKDNKKWIGTLGKGIAFFDDETWSIINTENSELLNDTILKVFIDSYDNKWIGTNSGLCVYREGGVILNVKEAYEPINNNSVVSCYPNPFNQTTKIKYKLDMPANVKITVYNSLGQEVAVIVDEWQEFGEYKAVFDARELSSGLYYYCVSIGEYSDFGKMMLIK